MATDEATLVERTGAKVYTVDGEQENIKITWKQDMRRLEPRQMDFRVGIGFDFHRFGPARPFATGWSRDTPRTGAGKDTLTQM